MPRQASTSSPKSNVHGLKLLSNRINHELLEPNETITGARYQLGLMPLRWDNKVAIIHAETRRSDSITWQCSTTCVIM